jgi:hypothetical protein
LVWWCIWWPAWLVGLVVLAAPAWGNVSSILWSDAAEVLTSVTL